MPQAREPMPKLPEPELAQRSDYSLPDFGPDSELLGLKPKLPEPEQFDFD